MTNHSSQRFCFTTITLVFVWNLVLRSCLVSSFAPHATVGNSLYSTLATNKQFFKSKLFMADAKATLSDETTWQLRFVLRGIPTTKGRRVDQIFNIQAQFIEEDGYEPPQGSIRQMQSAPTTEPTSSNDTKDDDTSSSFQVVKSRWILSEDPNDRKDGLWVWGLFKEPLYPFMLLQLETDKINLPGDDGDAIEPLQLFAQIDHKRDDEKGVVLSRATLKVRLMETVNADLFGVSKADIYEEKTVGQLVFQPTTSSLKSVM